MQLNQQLRRVAELLGGSASPKPTAAVISDTERRLRTTLPDDVRTLLASFDGSDEATPVENGSVRLWHLSEWRRVSDEPASAKSRLPEAVLFADHSIESWWYTFDFSGQPLNSTVYMIAGDNEDRLVATSLGGFLQAIIDDSDALYRGVPEAG